MAGPAIRAYELARTLSKRARVKIAATEFDRSGLDVPCGTFDRHSGRSLAPHLDGVDFVMGQPQWPLVMRALRHSSAQLIFDLYAPDPLETLEYLDSGRPVVRRLISAMTVDRVSDALRAGNHFICATDSQRDLWLGTMIGERLMRPDAYDRDPSVDSLISIVPFGVPDEPPPRSGGIRARFPQIEASDEVVVWNGGLWN